MGTSLRFAVPAHLLEGALLPSVEGEQRDG
jgi:hypothetical protein